MYFPPIATARIIASCTRLLAGQTAEVDVEARQQEEDREQEQHRDLLEPDQDLVAHRRRPLVRDDRAEQERAEDVVHVEQLGRRGEQQQPDQDNAHDAGGQPARLLVGDGEPVQLRPNHQEGEERERDREEHQPLVLLALTAADRDHHGEQGPGQDVVGGSAGEGDAAGLGAVHLAVGEDSRQHREGRHRHRGAYEQRERQEVVTLLVLVLEDRGEPEAEGERQQDRGDRDGSGHPTVALDQRRVQLEAHDEHEQHQTEAGQHCEVGPRVDREELVAQLHAEDAGTQQDAGGDLTDDRGLTDLREQPAHDAGQHDDDCQLDQDRADLDRVHGPPLSPDREEPSGYGRPSNTDLRRSSSGARGGQATTDHSVETTRCQRSTSGG